MKKLRKCISCSAYSLAEKCAQCGGKTAYAHPPKFSMQDRYAKYRRMERYGIK